MHQADDGAWAVIIAPAREHHLPNSPPVTATVPFDTYDGGCFVSNQFEPKVLASFAVIRRPEDVWGWTHTSPGRTMRFNAERTRTPITWRATSLPKACICVGPSRYVACLLNRRFSQSCGDRGR